MFVPFTATPVWRAAAACGNWLFVSVTLLLAAHGVLDAAVGLLGVESLWPMVLAELAVTLYWAHVVTFGVSGCWLLVAAGRADAARGQLGVYATE